MKRKDRKEVKKVPTECLDLVNVIRYRVVCIYLHFLFYLFAGRRI